jgi:hypothetical protein
MEVEFPQPKLMLEWLTSFSKAIESDFEQAGLLDHNLTQGQVREAIVRRVLSRVLPESYAVTSGLVIDSHNQRSRQIDIIVYDRRLPTFDFLDGIRLVPVEGVAATIEVKTRIESAKEVEGVLENCASVARLTRMTGPGDAGSLSNSDLEALAWLAPTTCGFAMWGCREEMTVREWVQKWVDADSSRTSADLPKCMLIHDVVGRPSYKEWPGSKWGLGMRLGVGEVVQTAPGVQKVVPPAGKVIWGVSKASDRFAWLIATVLTRIFRRERVLGAAVRLQPVMEHYLNMESLSDRTPGWWPVYGKISEYDRCFFPKMK